MKSHHLNHHHQRSQIINLPIPPCAPVAHGATTTGSNFCRNRLPSRRNGERYPHKPCQKLSPQPAYIVMRSISGRSSFPQSPTRHPSIIPVSSAALSPRPAQMRPWKRLRVCCNNRCRSGFSHLSTYGTQPAPIQTRFSADHRYRHVGPTCEAGLAQRTPSQSIRSRVHEDTQKLCERSIHQHLRPRRNRWICVDSRSASWITHSTGISGNRREEPTASTHTERSRAARDGSNRSSAFAARLAMRCMAAYRLSAQLAIRIRNIKQGETNMEIML